MEGVTEALAKELAPLGIFETTVEPGYFRTNFLDDASLLRAEKVIEDYAETAGAIRGAAPTSAIISPAIRLSSLPPLFASLPQRSRLCISP